MSGLNALVSDNIGIFAILLLVLVVVLFALLLRVGRRAAVTDGRLADMTRGQDGKDLGQILEAHLDKVYSVSRRQDSLDGRVGALDSLSHGMVRGVGLVRFNTFDDMGGNQSFALVLTDVDGNGVVLSSLHARNQTRLYAKGVAAGQPEGALSGEEAEALKLALTRAKAR